LGYFSTAISEEILQKLWLDIRRKSLLILKKLRMSFKLRIFFIINEDEILKSKKPF
jgi:hypothetical protein